jgi:propionyl-CoA carboxylase beta chain
LGGGKKLQILIKLAREANQYLLDENSFEDRDVSDTPPLISEWKEQYYGDGVITGYGTINGRLVYIFAQDLVLRFISETHAEK